MQNEKVVEFMFIGSSNIFPDNESPIGNCYRLKKDIEVFAGKFMSGSVMGCIEYKNGYCSFKDEKGYILYDVREEKISEYFEKITS